MTMNQVFPIPRSKGQWGAAALGKGGGTELGEGF